MLEQASVEEAVQDLCVCVFCARIMILRKLVDPNTHGDGYRSQHKEIKFFCAFNSICVGLKSLVSGCGSEDSFAISSRMLGAHGSAMCEQ